MATAPAFLHRLRLRHLLFAFLLLFGVLPLIFSSLASLRRNRAVLEQEEKESLVRQAEHLSQQLSLELNVIVRQLEQLGAGLETLPSSSTPTSTSAGGATGGDDSPVWLENYLRRFVEATGPDFTTRVVFVRSQQAFGPNLPSEIDAALGAALERLGDQPGPRFDLVEAAADGLPWGLVSLRVGGDGYFLQAAKPLPIPAEDDQGVFLLDMSDSGKVIWADPKQPALARTAVARSPAVQGGLSSTAGAYPVLEYPMRIGSNRREMIGQLSRLADTGWVVLVQKQKSAALRAVTELATNAALTVLVTVALALVFGSVATRALSRPIQDLAETSQKIAAGEFGQLVTSGGAGREIVELGNAFNQMSGQVEDHVQRLKEAAQVNRDLFIGTIRALLAAVEAKEPYTRGHSERVASYSQAIARQLMDKPEFAEQIWIAGLLHDVGKIGIDDRVLNKGDVLTDEEFEMMKQHPVIGAEIMASIQQMRNMLPAIRWHHERWVGGGYPDGLSGEDIPLMARIVAVADTFDAVTTQRVYQDPYTPEQAVEIIRKLAGQNFDPRVVDAFLTAYGKGDIRLLKMTRSQKLAPAVETAEVVHT